MSVGAQMRQMDAEADAAARAAYEAEKATAIAEQAIERAKASELMNEAGGPTVLGWRKINENLRKPMSTQEFTGRGGRTFKYITARQVQDRLDAVVGAGNWSTQVQVVRAEHPVAVLVGLAVFEVWRWDAGYSNNPDASPEDKQYEDEPLKAAVSDGFKRAAVQWSIGRWLYQESGI